MKKLLLLPLAAAVGVGAVVVFLPARSGRDGSGGVAVVAHGRQRAEWDAFAYQLREAPRTRRYNLPVTITVEAEAEPCVRLLLDVQDPANYYFVELAADHTRLGKVESGLEAPLGAWSDEGLRPGATHRVVVKRRHDTLAVVLDGSIVAQAEDEAYHGGQYGVGTRGDGATVEVSNPQPCDPLYFADNFMRTGTEDGGWTPVSGYWKVATLRNPSLSSNAFYYLGTAPGGSPSAISVRGQWFWDDYRLTVACSAQGHEDVGLLACYRDADNYLLFRWNADQRGQRGRKQLVKRRGGQESVLAEQPGGYQPGVWYGLEVVIAGTRVRTYIDGHLIFEVIDPDQCFGQIGLYSATANPAVAYFDDVLVQTIRSFEDDFSVVAASRWQALGGTWQQRQGDGGHACFVSAEGPAKAVAGSRRWRDYTASAVVRLPERLSPASGVGLVAHYLDEMNYASLAWRPAAGVARLEAFVEGERVALEEAQAPQAPPGSGHILDLRCDRGVLVGHVDGMPVVSAWAPGLPRGKVGLYATTVQELAFHHVRVRFPLPPEPVLTHHEVFSRELSMEVWAGASSDWEDTYETLDGHSVQPHWHRADFFGDATVEVELKDEARKAAASGAGSRTCRLVLSAQSTRTVASGYNFVLRWPTAGDANAACRAVLTRGTTVVAQKDVVPDGEVRRLRFQRLAGHVIASVNEEQVLAFKDAEPLAGHRAAFVAVGLPIDKQHVAVFSDNVKVYTFSRASSDWRAAAGTWQISNRWECDPRWSFFSGVPDGSRLAAIWNKYAFEGDVSVEFAVGPKMENIRGGGSYRYARDFNVTLCADGRDLSSGYSFLFGGWDNARTAIVRGGRLLVPSSFVIQRSSSIHRKWYYIKVEKRGHTLNYWIDGSRILTVQDPQPLTGSRIALWSWDCGLMVARVRISAERIREREAPGRVPGPCRTIYSMGN